MSVGNIQTYGQKGSNMPYQLKSLLNLVAIANNTGPGGGLATEATALAILAAIQAGQEFEQNLVIDTGDPGCPNCTTYLQIRIFDTVTHTFGPPRFFDANGVEFFLGGNPLYGPMQLVNPQFVLTNILAQLTAINANIDVPLSTRASEATLAALGPAIVAALGPKATTADIAALLAGVVAALAPKATTADITALSAAIVAALGPLATEATLAAFSAKFTAVVRTPAMLRAAAPGTVTAGKRSVSFFNAGLANATVLTVALLPGEQIDFSAGAEDDTLDAIAYDGTGTDLLITTVE